jgi:threonine synthase
VTAPASALSGLACARCGEPADADRLQTVCRCGGTLFASYNFSDARRTLTAASLRDRPPGIWRWEEILPVRDSERRRGLGEGSTPLLQAGRLGARLGLARLLLKDEGRNPGGSFKARGMAVAVARAVELGAGRFALPSAGNAGGAAAAYGAAWGAEVHVALPLDTPEPFREEVRLHGGHVHDVDGDIADAGRRLGAHPNAESWFFLSTLKEPYRVEGKKTMGLELVEQFGWRWPAVVIYPTGGGTGIVGMMKADAELRALGLLEGPPPRFVVVQADGCAPLVRAHAEGKRHAEPWVNPRTAASGLRVPGTIGDHLILDAVRRTDGTALTVTDTEMEEARAWIGADEGLFVAPEAAATVAAAARLVRSGWLDPDDETVLFVTGDGFKYPRVHAAAEGART